MHKEPEMPELVVREVCVDEAAAATCQEIIEAATRELRNTYHPRENRGICGGTASTVLVAFNENSAVGTAEYIRKQHTVYVQGIAVHQDYRGRGVCRALLSRIEDIAKAEKLRSLTLCAIEETGNVGTFKKLGFEVVNRATAPNHVSPSGDPVTQVDMERRIV